MSLDVRVCYCVGMLLARALVYSIVQQTKPEAMEFIKEILVILGIVEDDEGM